MVNRRLSRIIDQAPRKADVPLRQATPVMIRDHLVDHPISRPVVLALQVVGLLVAARLGWHFLEYLWHAIESVRYPYGLDYGEGIVWQQALLIPGPRMYGDITRFPFIVFHYPPVYHLAVRTLAATGLDMLAVGRSVSVVCALIVGGVVARLAFLAAPESIGRAAKLTGSTVAGLTVFCYEPVVVWSMLMRVDMLAVALSFLAVWYVVTSAGHPWRLYAGALLFLLAMFTKQTSIAAPLAIFPVMLMIDRRRTLIAAGAVVLAGLGLLMLLELYTNGGFLSHIVLYNVNRYRLGAVIDRLLGEWPHAVFLLMTIIGLTGLWRRLAHERDWQNLDSFKRDVAANMVVRLALVITLYLCGTTAMLAMIGKSGAGDNYLIEGMCVWSVIIGTLVASHTDRVIGYLTAAKPGGQRAIHPLFTILLGWLLAFQMIIMPTSGDDFRMITPASIEALNSLRSRIESTQRPVLSDDMALLVRAGKEVPWEPAIFAELASRGRWDQRLIINRIEAHAFAMIVTTGCPGTSLYDARYTPEVNRAIGAAYPRTEQVAERTVHLPAD